jgi:hypothetical protein
MTNPNLDALAKLAPFNDGIPATEDDIMAALSEWADLRGLLELVAGNLLSAQEKRGDAPMSANEHLDEATQAICRFAPTAGAYGDRANAMRLQLWTVNGEMANELRRATQELAELRAYRDRTEAALQAWCDDLTAFLDEPDGEAMHLFTRSEIEDLKESGLWRDPAPKEASDDQ